ncbi:MAG: succinate dehydrogenase, cytochrome b556 subunit, partial [Sedimenticola sp.]|nr:succinate dehydrogenase, cytochrome b556 subunit [Sedimenticola sp.]
MTTKNRPVYLDLTQFRFPIAAIMSVGHRASGVLMILAIPFLAYILDLSLSGPEGFA